MRRNRTLAVGAVTCVAMLGGLLAIAQTKPATPPAKPAGQAPPAGEQERPVTEAEVPKAALAALKKLAGSAAIKEFAQEIEHGHTFYEGSWAGPAGHVDALVTESGDLVEIEESIPADRVPLPVRAATEQVAGKDARPSFEKKTLVLYEIHFTKDGASREAIFTTDGRAYHEEGAGGGDHDEDEHEHGGGGR